MDGGTGADAEDASADVEASKQMLDIGEVGVDAEKDFKGGAIGEVEAEQQLVLGTDLEVDALGEDAKRQLVLGTDFEVGALCEDAKKQPVLLGFEVDALVEDVQKQVLLFGFKVDALGEEVQKLLVVFDPVEQHVAVVGSGNHSVAMASNILASNILFGEIARLNRVNYQPQVFVVIDTVPTSRVLPNKLLHSSSLAFVGQLFGN